MKDIYNNKNSVNNNKPVNLAGHVKKKKDNAEQPENSADTLQQNSSDYSAIIGRSQVKFGTIDKNLRNDLEVFVKNPKQVADANLFCDLACHKFANKEHPYEFACTLADEFFHLNNSDEVL